MTRDRAMRALDHGDKVIATVRAYVAQLEKQLERTMRERDELQKQLKSHRQSMIQRVYTHTQEIR
jgi:hypothetical protein